MRSKIKTTEVLFNLIFFLSMKLYFLLDTHQKLIYTQRQLIKKVGYAHDKDKDTTK